MTNPTRRTRKASEALSSPVNAGRSSHIEAQRDEIRSQMACGEDREYRVFGCQRTAAFMVSPQREQFQGT